MTGHRAVFNRCRPLTDRDDVLLGRLIIGGFGGMTLHTVGHVPFQFAFQRMQLFLRKISFFDPVAEVQAFLVVTLDLFPFGLKRILGTIKMLPKENPSASRRAFRRCPICILRIAARASPRSDRDESGRTPIATRQSIETRGGVICCLPISPLGISILNSRYLDPPDQFDGIATLLCRDPSVLHLSLEHGVDHISEQLQALGRV